MVFVLGLCCDSGDLGKRIKCRVLPVLQGMDRPISGHHRDIPQLWAVFSAPTLPQSNSIGLPLVRPDVPTLHQGQWLPQGLIQFALLGRWERQNRSPTSAEDIPSRNSCHPTVTSPMHQPKPQLSWASRKSNQKRDGFAVPSECPGGGGLGTPEWKKRNSNCQLTKYFICILQSTSLDARLQFRL